MIALLASSSWAASSIISSVKWNLYSEVGAELDSNAMRVVTPAPLDPSESAIAAPLFRAIADGGFRLGLWNRSELSLHYGGGTKLFFLEAARPADELIHHGSFAWWQVWDPIAIGLIGDAYDAYLRESWRDFRTGSGTIRLSFLELRTRFDLFFDLGYRGFQFKPDSAYTFHGLLGTFGISQAWQRSSSTQSVEWRLSVTYTPMYRFYEGYAHLPANACQDATVCLSQDHRRDANHLIRLQVGYACDAEMQIDYTAELNRSNSQGKAYERHSFGFGFTTPLVWDFFLSARTLIQVSRFDMTHSFDPNANVSFFMLEDENRSSLTAQLSRYITSRWSFHLRYGLYASGYALPNGQETHSSEQGNYFRQTLSLNLRFEYEQTP